MFIVWRRNVPKELIKIISVGHTTHNEIRNTRNVCTYIKYLLTILCGDWIVKCMPLNKFEHFALFAKFSRIPIDC